MDNLAPFIYIVGLLALGAVTVYDRWTSKTNDNSRVSTEVIETYRTQVQQLREEVGEEKKARQELAIKLAQLQGAAEEKDKKITELTAIFQGRNPETEQYMKDMREFTAGVAQYMKDSAEILQGMKTFMTQLNDKGGK